MEGLDNYDYVNPDHYKKGDKEVWQMMVDIWGREAFVKHCEMCAFKYRMRIGEKPNQPVDRDLEKARWYEAKAKEVRQAHRDSMTRTVTFLDTPIQIPVNAFSEDSLKIEEVEDPHMFGTKDVVETMIDGKRYRGVVIKVSDSGQPTISWNDLSEEGYPRKFEGKLTYTIAQAKESNVRVVIRYKL